MRFSNIFLALLGSAALFLGGCSTAPPTSSEKTSLHNDAAAAMDDIKLQDPTLVNFLHDSYGYAIFPSVGKGAVGVGGAYGQGEVYQQGNRIGYADMSQATVGVALGGETYSELIVFENPSALERFKSSQLTFAADASAVAVKSGVGADAKFQNGAAVFIKMKGGLMGEASIGGQKFNYQPL